MVVIDGTSSLEALFRDMAVNNSSKVGRPPATKNPLMPCQALYEMPVEEKDEGKKKDSEGEEEQEEGERQRRRT
ncbi:hypothetical protein Ahy_B02g058478 [Arachis hypogaea]|uniref:Uncharacterized protein n=1 Tax=Arachis hypogaea TaxID=3818 RepID=A0A445AEP6_ARAHY|nr:hypothetical protein Ahy_B02g058478 [Arachis hypogaea]